jgi:type VI secretion system lysozyme-like protein
MALLEKLSSTRRWQGARGQLERILANLEHVLNCKRGYGSLLPDFGIRPLTEHTTREAIGLAVMQDVRECIERYEPRLRLDQLALDEERDPLRLSFTLRCTVLTDPHELQISFDTVFNQFGVARR